MGKIQLLIADDDPLVRVALSHFVSRDPELTVIAEAKDGFEAIAAIDKFHPDVVMMDVQMPGMGGIEATEIITERWPDLCVVAVTTMDTRETVLPMLNAGASGYMLKDSSAEEILAALRQAHDGETVLSPRIAGMLVRHVRGKNASHAGELAPLTARELEVLQCLATGMSNIEISRTLHLSEGTTKAHLGSIISKWQVRDRVQILVAAARAGLIDFQ